MNTKNENPEEELKEQVEKQKCVGEHDFIVQITPILTQTGALDYVIVIKVCRLCGEVKEEILKQEDKPVIHTPYRKK